MCAVVCCYVNTLTTYLKLGTVFDLTMVDRLKPLASIAYVPCMIRFYRRHVRAVSGKRRHLLRGRTKAANLGQRS